MTNTITMPRSVVEQALEALKIGHQSAQDCAETFHVEMAGYKQQRHEALDAEVKQISDAIGALRAALEQPQGEQEPVAWMHQCRKKPELVKLSFKKREPALAASGYKARPLIFGDTVQPLQPLTDEQQIAEALRRNGLALVKTANGYDVLKLGQITAHKIGGEA